MTSVPMAVSLIPDTEGQAEEIKRYLYSYLFRVLYGTTRNGGAQTEKLIRQAIKKGLSTEAKYYLTSKSLDIRYEVRTFFLFTIGNVFQRFLFRIKKWKRNFADWLAKKLIPHSPWLQGLVEMTAQYRKERKHERDGEHECSYNIRYYSSI